ncbi:tyrosine-type recombinase/integrase [Psychromonas ossibalaenae]|uniref:tyrosine-type recombinase/integrase n=1 Tax=Psychromonas ossibalaenae TaxID=444922 RepID=UPI00037653CC|nr:site-specific integrase [Psychromonas ossibalaenae]
MSPSKFKFNKRQIDSLPATATTSKSRETEYTDESCSGLKLIVNRQGRKRFLFRYTFNRVKRSMQLGEYPGLDIATARLIANGHKKELALGNDPKLLRDEQKSVPTFYEFSELHYLPFARVNKLTAKSDEGNLKMHFYPVWARKPLDQITQHDIQKRLDELLATRKPSTVNRLRSLILRILKLSVEWGFTSSNPGLHIKKLRENNLRQKFLDQSEVAIFMSACDADENKTQANALKFALLTGMRIGEICRAKWEDLTVDDANGSLYLPHTKAGLARTVILNKFALGIINQQKQYRKPNNPFIFPSHEAGKAITNPKKTFARIKKRARVLGNLRIHDLRHSFASILINSGNATLYDVQHLLGHHSPQTTTRYAHITSSRLRDVSNNVSDLVIEATNIQE